MKPNIHIGLLLACSILTSPATDRFVSLDGAHVSPFTSWADAATNIQAAIDVASAGDVVWATNGVYATGGKVMAGDLTNRIAIDKAITVRSVNGPFSTAIRGNGASTEIIAVRCVWLTNGATLQGFTLTGGGTRASGDISTLRSGGGAWCSSSNATLANCLIVTNACSTFGGGAYQGTLRNCFISRNTADGAYGANLVNCTVTSNSSWGVTNCRLTNSIVAYNNSEFGISSLTYCCTLAIAPGVGNVSGSPRLLQDGIRLANDSPCRAAGTNITTGTDIYDKAWSNPPAIGCAEWQPQPLIIGQPKVQLTSNPVGFSIGVTVNGQEPFTCWWFRDTTLLENDGHYSGAHTTNLVAAGIFPFDIGSYQVVVSNVFGVVTGAVQVVGRYVDAAGTGPLAPYSTWATAATNIQDAINFAQPGEIVLVTNGVYATGGKVKAGDLTNRVALDKAIAVQSINGPGATIIQGVWDPTTTNGPLAVRCAWLTNGAILSGFRIQGGATRNALGGDSDRGGGIWCSSTSATVINCEIIGNCALSTGGGAYYGTLSDCIISNNATLLPNINGGGGVAYSTLRNCWLTMNSSASVGGGAREATLYNCAVTLNSATSGGGCHQSRLDNCTVSRNSARASGGGVFWAGSLLEVFATNCVVWNNYSPTTAQNYFGGTLAYSCTYPLPTYGTGNISTDPQLLGDGFHLAESSPCRNAGNQLYASGTDIDGQSWGSPPAMGCDQWHPEPLVAVEPLPKPALGNGQVRISTVTAGQEPLQYRWSKNGLPLVDDAHYTNAQSASLLIRDFGVGDAGAYQVVASNAFDVVTSQVVQVTVRCVDVASAAPAPPYTTWESAATTIQDAVDAAGPDNVILVTNGVYAIGGRPKSGDLTNRVVVDKPLLLVGVNGPEQTVIQGQWDPISTNGPASVRCVWLGDGAALSGFTLRNGATTKGGNGTDDGSGGGVRNSSTNAELANCVVTNCCAWFSGGGAQNGTLVQCRLVGNVLLGSGGGGASSAFLVNCLVTRNKAAAGGGGVFGGQIYNCAITENYSGNFAGGAYLASLINCTVTANVAASSAGGVSMCSLNNCIVYLNSAPTIPNGTAWFIAYNTCSTPLLTGTGNIATDPQLTDGWHLSAASPCRGMGSVSIATGTDLDGDPWSNPPSMGCDEVDEAAMVGDLSVSLSAAYPEVAACGSLPLTGVVSGRAARVEWSFGDGPVQTNLSALTFHTWTNPGDYLVTFTAYNADNPAGVSASKTVHVVPFQSPRITALGKSGTNFTMSFPGQAGITYVVEQTTNLAPANWQTVQALISTGSVIQVTDTRATNAMRFYRTRMQ